MAFENFPAGAGEEQKLVTAKSAVNWKGILTGALLVSLLGTWGYIIYDKNKVKETVQQKEALIASTSLDRDNLQKELDDATSKYDMLKTDNAKKDSSITAKDREIAEKKSRIQALLSKVNASKADLAEAQRLIASLRTDIEGYKAQVEQLQGENLVLTQEKAQVTEERDRIIRDYDSAKVKLTQREADLKQKEDVIDVGSTLHASNFNIEGINEKKGGREKKTSTAKKVDKLRITFDLDENRIAQSGNKDIYVCITAPDGTPVAVEAAGSGKFNTREGQEKLYTKKVDVNYVQGQRQTVNFDWKQDANFTKGGYKIEVYHNGFKIGEGVTTLKKGFLG
jgi:chromosome segregation ATPase